MAEAKGRLRANGTFRIYRAATGRWEGPYPMTASVKNASPGRRRIRAALIRAAGRIKRWLA